MAFYGRSFIYDGTPSELYGLLIGGIDSNAVNQSMASNAVEIVEQSIYRKPTPYLYGMTPSPKLEFEFSAFAEKEITADEFEIISKWLFSSRSYKSFQIDQPDMQDVLFYAIFQDPKIDRVGNLIQGFSATVVCNSPFAYKFPKTTTYNYTATVVDSTETYFNSSDDRGDYLYPSSLVITMNDGGGDVSITNLSDGNRVVSLTSLLPNEVITMSSIYQTMSSSTGLRRLANSNKKFLRLAPGVNRLRVQGNVASIAMTNQFVAKKIGG